MNPNDILAQQQAYMNQVMQNAQQLQWLYLIVALIAMVVHFGLVYLFYARLRDIAEELLKLRIAFEMAEDRKAQAARVAAKSVSGKESGDAVSTEER